MKILIVEDDDISRLMLRDILAKLAECHVAVNGKEGVKMFEDGVVNGRPYDVILMDLMMPEMNGHTLVRLIREYEAKTVMPRTKVIVITACNSPWEMSEMILDGWCDEYIVKPFDRDRIQKLVATYPSHQSPFAAPNRRPSYV